MKKFEFRFEAVEKVRGIEMDKQIKEVSIAQKKVVGIENEMDGIEGRLQAELQRISDVDVQDLLNQEVRELSSNFMDEMRRQLQEKKKTLLEAKTELVRERRKLIERQKKKKAMELLREKDEEKHYAEQQALETEELDEISSNFWIHRRSTS